MTEGEGSFEAALLNAITGEDELIDPRNLFKQDLVEDEITEEDNAFWNVDVDEPEVPQSSIEFATVALEKDPAEIVQFPVDACPSQTPPLLHSQPRFTAQSLTDRVVSEDELDAILTSLTDNDKNLESDADTLVKYVIEELGGVVSSDALPAQVCVKPNAQIDRQHRYVSQYLERLSYTSQDRLRKYLPRLMTLVRDGEWDHIEDVKQVAGILEDHFLTSDPMKKRLTTQIASWMRQKRLVSGDDAGDIAQRVIDLSLMAFDLIPLQIDIFEGMRIAHKEIVAKHVRENPIDYPTQARKRSKKKKLDLLAIPDDSPDHEITIREQGDKTNPVRQLKLFS